MSSCALQITLNGLPWAVNSSFNVVASSFPFPFPSFLCNFCFFFAFFSTMFIGPSHICASQTLLLGCGANVLISYCAPKDGTSRQKKQLNEAEITLRCGDCM